MQRRVCLCRAGSKCVYVIYKAPGLLIFSVESGLKVFNHLCLSGAMGWGREAASSHIINCTSD